MAEKEQIRTKVSHISYNDSERSFSASFTFPEKHSNIGGYYNDSDPVYLRLSINNYDSNDVVFLTTTNSGEDVDDGTLLIRDYGGSIDLFYSNDYEPGDTIRVSGHFEAYDSWCSLSSVYVLYRAEVEDFSKVYIKVGDEFLYTTDMVESAVASNTIGKFWVSVADFERIMHENFYNPDYVYPGARNSPVDVYLGNGYFSGFYNSNVRYYSLVKKDKIYLRQNQ